jgi:hypothetical protein
MLGFYRRFLKKRVQGLSSWKNTLEKHLASIPNPIIAKKTLVS